MGGRRTPMPRIAMLLSNPCTHDARVMREARALAARGHEVTIHCVLEPGLPEGEEDGNVWVVRHADPDWIHWRGAGRLASLWRWFARYEFLAAAAEREGPDVVHGHDLETLVPAARLSRRLGIPLVYDDHELGVEKLDQGLDRDLGGAKGMIVRALTARVRRRALRYEHRLLPRAAGVITASPLYAKTLRERHGVEPLVILNTPERPDHEPDSRLRDRAGIREDESIVLYQGGVTSAGGAIACIDAAASFPDGWRLVFLGTRALRPSLEAHARERGLGDDVVFLDAVPPDELPGFTRAADIGLAPFLPANDGQAFSLANKIFEYLHAGLPIVASDLPAQGPLVRELDAGEVLADVTAEHIAAAVGRLAGVSAEERTARRERLRAVARERFSWSVEAEKLTDLYDRVLRDSLR